MPASVNQALILKFADRVEHAFQQKVSFVRGKADVKVGQGTMTAFNIMNPSSVTDITGLRESRTAWQDIDQYNRWAPQQAFNHAVRLSRYDRLAALADLQSSYIRNGAMAHMRNIDDVFIAAAFASAIQGETPGAVAAEAFDTAAPNNDGSGGNLIAAGGVGMTATKIKAATGTFLTRNVGVDGLGSLERGSFGLMMGGYQMRQLLDDTEATSWDFIGDLGPQNAPNVQGFVARYGGFDIVVSNRLPLTAGVRRCLAWHRDAMGIAIWSGASAPQASDTSGESSTTTESFYVTLDRLPDYNNAMGSQVMANFGAVRKQDIGVLGIDAVE